MNTTSMPNYTRYVFYLFISLLLVMTSSCSDRQKEDEKIVKNIIENKYHGFEKMAQNIIRKNKDFRKTIEGEWLWKITPTTRNHEYKAKYGWYRKQSGVKTFFGELVAEITSALSFGLLSYNPFGENLGIYYTVKVNIKKKTANILK